MLGSKMNLLLIGKIVVELRKLIFGKTGKWLMVILGGRSLYIG